MKFFLPSLLCIIFLAGCGNSPVTETYTLTFPGVAPAQQMSFTQATESVFKRKFKALNVESSSVKAVMSGSGQGLLTITAPRDQLDAVHAMVTENFSLVLRTKNDELTAPSLPDIRNWTDIGVSGADLLSISLAKNPTPDGRSVIDLVFTPEATTTLKEVFRKGQGKDLGIFVRDILVSKLTMKGVMTDRMSIGGVPSEQVAKIFIDDVNVGLRVRITPR